MASKNKACKDCRAILHGGSKCPNCGSENITDAPKGKIVVLNPEESEIATNLKITKKGEYAIKA